MLKGLGVLMFMGLLVAATIGLAGGGPDWLRYVGSGTVLFLLMLILTQVSNMADRNEIKKMVGGGGGEELYSAPEIDTLGQGAVGEQDLASRN